MEFNDDDKNLTILAEVIQVFAEMIQTISKIKRFGLDDCSPYTPDESNRKKLTEECGHVMAMIDTLCERNILDKDKVIEEAEKKLIKLEKWY